MIERPEGKHYNAARLSEYFVRALDWNEKPSLMAHLRRPRVRLVEVHAPWKEN